ncbi:MAG: nickel-binding protein [Pirellulales bacterium]
MHKFICSHTFPVGEWDLGNVCQIADTLQHEDHIRGYRSFFSLGEGKAVCVLEANDRETIATWFKEKGIPYDYILPVELEGEYGLIRDLREEPVMAQTA